MMVPNVKLNGFTLIEMMITVAILAILVAIAAPSFKNFILDQRIKNAAFDLNSALANARGEAVKRNANVTLTPVSTANWANGWSMTSGTTTIRAQGMYKNIQITGPISVIYSSAGRVPAVSTNPAAGKFTLDDTESISEVKARYVCVGLSGQPYNKQSACP